MVMQGIIFAGGRGRRMLPITSYISKPMLPVLHGGVLKPAIQIIFETLFNIGVRDFIIFAKDPAIGKYMRRNQALLDEMSNSNQKAMDSVLGFYSMLHSSKIKLVNRIGNATGNTLLLSKKFVSDDFVITAADVILDNAPTLTINSVLAAKTKEKMLYTTIETHAGVISKLHFRNEKITGTALLPYMRLDPDFIEALESINSTNSISLHMGLRELIKNKKIRVVMAKNFYDVGKLSGYVNSFRRF